MKFKFAKIKTEHTIMKEFHKFLSKIEQNTDIKRIIPGRISRQQSGRSSMRINFSYKTRTGLKYNMCKGSTAQEIFVITRTGSDEKVISRIAKHIENE